MKLKALYAIAIPLLLSICGRANARLDSLTNLLNQNQSDSVQVMVRIALAAEYENTDETAAMIHLKESVEIAHRTKKPYLLGTAYKKLGIHFFNHHNYRACIENLLIADGYFQKGDFKVEQASVINFIGLVYVETGNLFEALSKFIEVERLLVDNKDPNRLCSVYMNTGAAYQQLSYFDLAERYYEKSFIIAQEMKDTVVIGFILNNLGEVALGKSKYSKAKDFFERSIGLQESVGNFETLGLEYANLGMTYIQLEAYDSAAFYLEKATTIARYYEDQNALANIDCNKSALYNATGEFDKAIDAAKRSLDASQRIEVLIPQKIAYENLYLAYESVGDYENALHNHVAAKSIQDSIQVGGDKFGLLQVESEFDLQQQMKELETRSLEVVAPEKSFFESDLFVLIAFFVLLIILILILEARRKNTIKEAGEQNDNVDYLRSIRILLLLAAVFYPLLPYVLPKIAADVTDPSWPRFAISGILLVFYFLSYVWLLIRKYIDRIIIGLYILLITHSFFLIYINSLAIDFIIYLMLILTGIPAVFKKTWPFAVFGAFIFVLALLVGLTVEDPRVKISVFVGLIVAEVLVSFVIALSRSDLDRHLKFSNEAVNQADAIVFIVNNRGENIYTGQSIRNILGYDPHEFSDHKWIERLGVSRKEANRFRHNLILIAIGTIEPNFNPYQQFRTKTGEIKWFSVKEKRIDRDRVLVIGLDVTEHKKIQDELATSERNFRQINETLTDVFYLYNIEKGVCEYISPNSEEIMGVPPSFFYDGFSHAENYAHPEDKDRVLDASRMVRNGIPFDIEYRILVRDKLKWIREKSHPVRDESGEVIKHSGICQDITDRKKAEAEIQRLSLIASNTDNFILLVNNDNRVEWANQSFFNLTGFTEQETVGKFPLELISGRLTSETLIREIGEAIFNEKRQMRCEMINYTKEEEIFYSNLEVTPILDERGNLSKYFVIGSDITKEVTDQERIEQLSLVASNTSNYVIIANNREGIEWVNQAFIDKFGYTLKEVVGKLPSSFLHQKGIGIDQIDEINQTVFDQQKKYTGEMIHITKNGEEIYSNVNITPLTTKDDEVEKYFVLGVDISQRKKNEEAIERVNRELSKKERALNESEQNFRELIKSIKEVFWLADYESDEMIFVSDSYLQVFGRPGASLMENPESWRELIHPEDRDWVVAGVNERGKSGLFNEDFRITLDSGEDKWINSRIFRILDADGVPFRLSGFVEDITYKKQQELEVQKIADQLDIVHTIEKTILESESTSEIIYNTLDKTLEKLPLLRASLALFEPSKNLFYAYARTTSEEGSVTDGKTFNLADFGLYETLNKKRRNHLEDLSKKKVKTKTDEILISEGAKLVLMSPLLHGDELIGSLNVCFKDQDLKDVEHYTEITNEVANGLAIAIHQSQLKDELHSSNMAITASIDYAKMIQQSYIPTSLAVGGHFEDHLIINRPKDIVSGDFYWVGEYDSFKIIAVGDCTGHGVPGAFMTIIGISELNSIVTQNGIVDPGDILVELDKRIIAALSTSKDNIQLKDGMDVGIFCYNTETKEVTYAGARRPLYQFSEGNIKRIEGVKRSIGDTGDDFGIRFETNVIENVTPSDQFYIFSDGCTDQFGGERFRKFSRKRLDEVILSCGDLPLIDQERQISQALLEWQGDHFQTDDILFVGFKI